MTIQLAKIFEEKRKGYTPSIEVVAAILGCCWKKPTKNKEIANFMERKKLKGSSQGNISEALSHLDNRWAKIIKNDPDNLSLRERKNTVDFEAVIDFLFEYLYLGGDKPKPVGRDEHDEKQKSLLVKQIKKNRQKTGDWFLKMFFNREVLEYICWENKKSSLLKKYPEILLYLILSSDLASMRSFGSSVPANGDKMLSLKKIYAEQEDFLRKIGIEVDKSYSFEEYRKMREGKKLEDPEKLGVKNPFYAALMSSFQATIVTNYEKEVKSIRYFLSAINGIRQENVIF